MLISFIRESKHKTIPDSIKVVIEYKGCVTPETRVVCDGKIAAAGIHTVIKGEPENIKNYLNSIAPVWISKESPILERFILWEVKTEEASNV